MDSLRVVTEKVNGGWIVRAVCGNYANIEPGYVLNRYFIRNDGHRFETRREAREALRVYANTRLRLVKITGGLH